MADVQMSESYRAASTLALAGGFLESYTFLLHGHVFANAQTGNIALCGMAVASRDWIAAVKYLVPIVAFSLGVFAVDWVHGKWPRSSSVHWRQGVVLTEAVLLCGCFFLRDSPQDMLANLIVSIACALQVQTFRKVRGSAYASTMCTGNLRSATVAWSVWRKTRQVEAKRQCLRYVGIIGVFALGAALAVPLIAALREISIAFPIAMLIACACIMMRSGNPTVHSVERTHPDDNADCD